METLAKVFPLLLTGDYSDCHAFKFRHNEVVSNVGVRTTGAGGSSVYADCFSWPGKQDGVGRWVILVNLVAVGEIEDYIIPGRIKYITLKIPKKHLCKCHRYEIMLRQQGMVKVVCELPQNSLDIYGNPIKTERLWATPVSRNRCRIENIPFFVSEIGQDDIVETSGSGFERKFISIKEKKTRTIRISYKVEAKDDISNILKLLHEYFQQKNPKIAIESGAIGFVCLAVPVEMSEHDLINSLNNCPIDGEVF